jgi:hypothetical protein
VRVEPQDGIVVRILFEVGFEFGYDSLGQHLLVSPAQSSPIWSRDLSAAVDDGILLPVSLRYGILSSVSPNAWLTRIFQELRRRCNGGNDNDFAHETVC